MNGTPNSTHEKRFFRRSFGHRDSTGGSTRSTNESSLKERARAGKLKSSGSSVGGKTPVQALQLSSSSEPKKIKTKTPSPKATPTKIPTPKAASPSNNSFSKEATARNNTSSAIKEMCSPSLEVTSSEETECQAQAVRVAVRLRPLNPLEVLASKRSLPLLSSPSTKSDDVYDSFKAWTVEDIDGKEILVQKGAGRKVEGKNMFSFDGVFQEHMGTAHVYENFARPIVKAVLTGKHGTIFTYGTSGSGKTHSMQGDGKNGSLHKDGIIQLAVRDLFNHIKRDSGKREYVMRISFFEIYNEQVRDLLSMNHHHHSSHNNHSLGNYGSPTKASRSSPTKSSSRNSPSMRSHAGSRFTFNDVPPAPAVNIGVNIGGTSQGTCIAAGSEKKQVSSVDDVLKLLYAGNLNRAVATTIMNDTSSRSHAIFRLTIESRERIKTSARREDHHTSSTESDHIVRISALNFVDLAGSENTSKSGTVGSRRRESGKINQSLLSLSQVIHALSLPPKKRPKFINYRNSKLTRILQPHLSGNAVLAVLCCATPARANLEETRGTLKFGASAKRIQMKPVVNEVVDDKALIQKLKKELQEAQAAIKALAGTRSRTPKADNTTIESSTNNSDTDDAVVIGEVESPHDSSQSSPVTVGSSGREQRLEVSMERDQTPNHSRIEPSPLASPDVTPERVSSPNNLTDGKLYDISQVLDNRFRSCDQDSQAERSIQQDCNSTLSDFSSRPPTIRVVQDSPPSEVTIIRSPLSDIGDDVDINVRLNDAEERAKFLEEKLESADRLVELMTRDLRNARLCIHELVFRNVRLENQLASNTSMTHATVPSTVDGGMDEDSHKGAAMMTSERIGI